MLACHMSCNTDIMTCHDLFGTLLFCSVSRNVFSFSQQRGLFGQFANQSAAVSSGQMKRPNAISSTLMRFVDRVEMSRASMICVCVACSLSSPLMLLHIFRND